MTQTTNWPWMLAGNLMIAAKLGRKNAAQSMWIYTPATPDAMAAALKAVR